MDLMPKFQDFLRAYDFNLLESKFGGNVEIYSSNCIILKIVQDRNMFNSMEIFVKEDPDNWFSLNIIRSFILKNEDYLQALDFDMGLCFFMEYYATIIDLFNSKNYYSTIKSLKKLEDKRAEIRYGK
ncbi:hypothetical protein BH10BAC2_BH10BAC2_09870 [soil metagenome]